MDARRQNQRSPRAARARAVKTVNAHSRRGEAAKWCCCALCRGCPCAPPRSVLRVVVLRLGPRAVVGAELSGELRRVLCQPAPVDEERRTQRVLPSPKQFAAFDYCPFDDVRAVILGQDPYPTPGHAHGLASASSFRRRRAGLAAQHLQGARSDVGRAAVEWQPAGWRAGAPCSTPCSRCAPARRSRTPDKAGSG